MRAQASDEIGVFLSLTHDHSTFARGDVVGKVKTVRAKTPKRPHALPAVRASQRFARVFDEEQVATGTNIHQPVHIAHVAEDVHREHASRLIRDSRFQVVQVHVHRRHVHVHEHWNQAHLYDRPQTRGPAHRRDQHFVPGAELFRTQVIRQRRQREKIRRAARVAHHRERRPDVLCERLLEFANVICHSELSAEHGVHGGDDFFRKNARRDERERGFVGRGVHAAAARVLIGDDGLPVPARGVACAVAIAFPVRLRHSRSSATASVRNERATAARDGREISHRGPGGRKRRHNL